MLKWSNAYTYTFTLTKNVLNVNFLFLIKAFFLVKYFLYLDKVYSQDEKSCLPYHSLLIYGHDFYIFV